MCFSLVTCMVSLCLSFSSLLFLFLCGSVSVKWVNPLAEAGLVHWFFNLISGVIKLDLCIFVMLKLHFLHKLIIRRKLCYYAK